MRLLNLSSLTIKRRQANTDYIDEDGNVVKGTLLPDIPIRCNIQPFRNGDEQIELPEGVETDDAVFIYTQTKLLTNDEFNNQEADETTIDGLAYECFRVENWHRYGLSRDHYKTVFIRKDKLT